MSSHSRVVANFGAAVAVLHDSGDLVRAVPLRALPQLVAGDLVKTEPDSGGAHRVTELIERSSVLSRIDRRGQPKPLAANVTHLAVVSAVKPGIDQLLIDQFCIAAELAGINAIIVVNKADLLTDEQRQECEVMLDVYRRIGYPAVMVDTKHDGQLAPLLEQLNDRTLVLVGASGVGKSSIVQRLLPDLDVRVGAVSEATGLGSHTTTVTFWYEHDSGGSIIDSPGVRQYSVSHLSPQEVRRGYRELAEQSINCKFSDCSHIVEPDCAVKAALETGEIAQWRYDNYLKLLEQ